MGRSIIILTCTHTCYIQVTSLKMTRHQKRKIDETHVEVRPTYVINVCVILIVAMLCAVKNGGYSQALQVHLPSYWLFSFEEVMACMTNLSMSVSKGP